MVHQLVSSKFASPYRGHDAPGEQVDLLYNL
jgi:hypothetical protein